MLTSIVTLLAMATVAFAAPPAQATYCSEDNLLRAFQHTPTPASSYCKTASGRPTFLAATTYPASRLSSACSCFSRFPTEPTKAPACPSPSVAVVSGTSDDSAHTLSLTLILDPAQPCTGESGGAGYKVTNACGFFDDFPVVNAYKPENFFPTYDDCYVVGAQKPIDTNGVAVELVESAFHYPALLVDTGSSYQVNVYEQGEYAFSILSFTTPCSTNGCS